jgi:hypothetical protein
MMKIFKHIALILLVLLTVACERDSAVVQPVQLSVSDPDRFARFIDDQQSLAAGDYRIIATTLNSAAGQPGSYTFTIRYDDGSEETIDGNWVAGALGEDPNPDNHAPENIHGFTLAVAGGITIDMQSGLDSLFYLLDSNDNVIISTLPLAAPPWVTISGVAVNDVAVDLPANVSESVYYAQAYYDAIDPMDSRDTLYKWRLANCFTNDPDTNYGADVHVIFRDTKDLGYGRNMYWRFGCDGNGNADSEAGAVAVFVENFDVEVLPGFPYSTINLNAALQNQREFHFGSNAIEFNTWSAGNTGINAATNPLGRQFSKFYTFRPVSTAADADELRLETVDLDGRGDKAMPLPCIYCHGGRGLTLEADGGFYAHPQTAIRGDTNAKLQILDVDELEFPASGAFSRASQEALLKQLNQAMYCTYPSATPPSFCGDNSLFNTAFSPAAPLSGEWNGDFLRELVQGWYGGDATDDSFPAAGFDSSMFVPAGWDPADPSNAANPADIDVLYREVIKPTCLVCHARRGNTVNNDIDFSSYDQFISHIDQIEDYIYSRGIMPQSQLGFDLFWNSDQPATLARFLTNFSHVDNDGNIIPPGEPEAVLGPDRVVNVPVTVSATASQFAERYTWSIIASVNGSTPTLSATDSARVVFDTDMDGIYTLQLSVAQGNKTSTDSIDITVDSSLKAPAALGFSADIVPIFGTQGCDGCHFDDDMVAAGMPPETP